MSDCWIFRQLGELLGRPLAYGVLKPGPYKKDGISMIKIQDHQNGTIQSNNLDKIPISLHQEFKRTELNGGEIVISVVGSIGRTAIIPSHLKGANVSRAFAVIGVNEHIDTRFLNQYLNFQKVQSWFKEQCQGNAQQVLNLGTLKELEVPVPPLPEQKKIAEILSGIGDSISKELEQIRVLKEARRASLKNLTFGKGVQGERVDSRTEFGFIPSHWTCEQIPNCCLIENSQRKPIKREDRSHMRGSYPYHGATRIQDYISEFAYEGEYVLVGEDGDHFSKFDDWEMAQFASGRFNVSNHAHVIRGGDRCSTKWLFYSLLYRDLTLHLTRQGATRFKLSKASLEGIPVLVPPLEEQHNMVNSFDSMSHLIDLRSKKVRKMNIAKTAIANDLLSGRKRVSI